MLKRQRTAVSKPCFVPDIGNLGPTVADWSSFLPSVCIIISHILETSRKNKVFLPSKCPFGFYLTFLGNWMRKKGAQKSMGCK
jgi:hypothetical protein